MAMRIVARGIQSKICARSSLPKARINVTKAYNIKDVNGPLVRIELQTSSKLITVERERLFKEKYVQVF